MFNSESDNQSRSSSKIPQALDRNAGVPADLIVAPREVRHYTVEEDEHHTRLGEHAAVLWKFNKITDITVKLNDEKYPAHKTVLSCYSRYFKDMLLRSNGNVSVINLQLEAVTNEAFSALLQYMYTADLNLTCQNIGDVYTAARKLGMDRALDICSKILKGKERHDVHSVYVFVTARKLGLDEDASRALRTMCRRFEHIVGTQEFVDLSYEQVVEYLSEDKLATRSEVIVYLGALKWISVRYLDREEYAVGVISCVRFPMMNLNEVLACHNPPLLPGLVEIPAINQMLLTATCFVASKTINEEKRFQRYDCPERIYLLDRESTILWDTGIFDPEHHALYSKEVAASTIQASFRDYKAKKASKEQEQAAEVIQKAYRHHSQQQQEDEDYEEEDYSDEESEDELAESVAEENDESGEGRGGIVPFADKVRKSIVSFFTRSDPQVEVSEESINETRSRQRQTSKGSDHRQSNGKPESSGHSKRSSKWNTPYETTSVVEDLEKRDSNRQSDKNGYSYEDSIGTPTEEEENCFSSSCITGSKDKNLDAKQAEKSVAKLAKTFNTTEEDTYGAIVISGGFNSDNADHPDSGKLLLVYEPAIGEWSQLGEMHKPRHHHRIVYLKGFIYCIGGCNPERTKKKERMVPLKSCYSFDMSTRTWNKIARMRYCRVYHATAVVNGKIYVAGGKDENDCMLDSVEVYDPDSNSWEELPDPLTDPTIGAGVCSRDGKLWIVGGMSQDSKGKIAVSKNVNCYDPDKKEWSHNIPTLPFPRAFVSVAVCGSRVYVVGGSSHAGPSTPTEEMSSFDDVLYYDEENNTWNNAPRLPSPRHFVGAVAVYKSLFVLGGLTSFKKEALDDILLFNDESGVWVFSSRLPSPLCGFGAVSVPKLTLQKNKQ